MLRSHLWAVQVLGCFLVLSGCHRSVAGHYQLDLDETKKNVEQSAREHPEDADTKANVIKMLEATTLDIELGADGKMTSTTKLSLMKGHSNTVKGSWKQIGDRIRIDVSGETETLCQVDGDRLRCAKEVPNKLFGHYVLVRKK